jgi:hypothetical protein
MVKVRSRVYSSQKIKLNGGVIHFINGNADISEELYRELVDRKLPNIYKEGDEPEYKTSLESKLRQEVSEGNEEFKNEINRLKNIIESQKIELAKKDEEIKSWKKAVEDLQKGTPSSKEEKKEDDKEIETEKAEKGDEDIDDELFNELNTLTVKQLIEMGMTEEGGGFEEKDLKNKKKDEIIKMIMSKS